VSDASRSGPADEPASWPVIGSNRKYQGGIVSVREDEIEAPDGTRHRRDVIEHKGAVAVVAVDEHDNVLVLQQYRHPVGARLVELPAGLLDVDGEEPLAAAQRELTEEGLLEARQWSPLVTVATSPGVSDERVLIYLATEVSVVDAPADFAAHAEEADMTRHWVPLRDLVASITAGDVCDGLLLAGVLTLWAGRTASSG
jgi:8-oxo-dGTP pyrophosphatase MutT (NUDIX family)